LKNLIKRAFTICNQPYFLNSELQHIELVFTTINGYPVGLIKRIIKEVRNDHENQQPPQPMTDTTETNKENLPVTSKVKIYLPYAGKQGELITNELKKTVNKIFDKKLVTQVTFKSKKLSSCFNVKDTTQTKHNHNVVYKVKCPDCPATYIGEAGRRLQERVNDHGGRDKYSHVLKHSIERGHNKVNIENFSLLGKNFKTEGQRKTSEAFYIKRQKPTINVQRLSRPTPLFK